VYSSANQNPALNSGHNRQPAKQQSKRKFGIGVLLRRFDPPTIGNEDVNSWKHPWLGGRAAMPDDRLERRPPEER
jgi:hypothetical protein